MGSAPLGTLFKITKSGTYSVQYVFSPNDPNATHGGFQYATSMQHTNGILYGLPFEGGTAENGGVFYSLAEGIPPFVSVVGYAAARSALLRTDENKYRANAR